MKLRVPHACQFGCTPCVGVTAQDGAAWEHALAHAEQTGRGRVYLQATDIVRSPRLAAVVGAARGRRLQVALIEDGPGHELPGNAATLQQMGVAQVYVSLPDAAAEPAAAAGSESRRKQAIALLLALTRSGELTVGVHVPLSQRAVRELPAVLRVLARLSIRELLISDVAGERGAAQGLETTAAVAALERVWLAANVQRVRLRLLGFERTRYLNPPAGEPAPACDNALLDFIRNGIQLPSSRAGIRLLGGANHPTNIPELVTDASELRQLGLELAARRAPIVDLPPCLGGTHLDQPAPDPPALPIKSDACPTCPLDARCVGASSRLADGLGSESSLRSLLHPLPAWRVPHAPRTLILSSVGGDGLFYISTLPALADSLRRRGVAVEMVSPWLSRWDPHVLPTLDQRDEAGDWMSTRVVEAWLETHDVGSFDLIITSDFPTARVVLGAASLGSTARVIVLDFHMLETMHLAVAAWVPTGARASDGGWWPSERMVVESGFPAHVQLYLNYGVPLEHVAWRPFPLCPAHFPAGPDVHRCATVFSGGQHLRDLDTLRAATARLPATVHPVDLYAFGERFEANPHLRHRGSVSLQAFYRALAGSRFVVLPLEDDANRAAGVTVLAMALMAGRPVVASSTPAVRDYVQHGVEALLVPPCDATALAEAITRLDTDPALLSQLADGAHQAGHRLSTEHWADQIASGRPLTPVPMPNAWRNW